MCWRTAVTGMDLNVNRSISFYSKGSSTMMQISNLFITQEDIISAGLYRYKIHHMSTSEIKICTYEMHEIDKSNELKQS